ncbi:MAG: hypothetical protein ACTSRA_00650 [Promethearchaeota archaeon]
MKPKEYNLLYSDKTMAIYKHFSRIVENFETCDICKQHHVEYVIVNLKSEEIKRTCYNCLVAIIIFTDELAREFLQNEAFDEMNSEFKKIKDVSVSKGYSARVYYKSNSTIFQCSETRDGICCNMRAKIFIVTINPFGIVMIQRMCINCYNKSKPSAIVF